MISTNEDFIFWLHNLHIQFFFVSCLFFNFTLTNCRILVLVSPSGDNFLINVFSTSSWSASLGDSSLTNVVGSLGMIGLGTPKPSKRWTQWSTRPASCLGRLDQHRRCRYNLFQFWHHRTYGGEFILQNFHLDGWQQKIYTHNNWTHLAPWELHGQAY